jgi:hypothetical protein
MSGTQNDTPTPNSKISSLRELPRNIAPPHDLWRGIEARLSEPADVGSGPVDTDTRGWRRPLAQATTYRVLAAAAVVAALAIGIWIGRGTLPVFSGPATDGLSASSQTAEPGVLNAAYNMDSRYTRDRAALAKSLQARLDALPPDSRAKVLASLTTIHNSIRDLQAALGRDPSNALLQELLVNTYQDEMRVLTAVNEAGNTGRGI